MKVELRLGEMQGVPHAVICARQMTPALAQAVALLEAEEDTGMVIPGKQNGKIFFLRAENLDLVRTEGREVTGYDTEWRRFVLSGPLYELAAGLGESFVRISKSVLVRIGAIDHVEASFNGTMKVTLRNGTEEYLSRSYRRGFREKLGI